LGGAGFMQEGFYKTTSNLLHDNAFRGFAKIQTGTSITTN